MPDVLTGCLALWLGLLVAGGDWLRRPWRAAGFALLGAFLIGSHLTHLPLAAGGALVGLGLRWAIERGRDPLRWRRAGLALAALLLAAGGLVGTNLAFGKKATLSESSPLFMLARMVGDGTAALVLEKDCPAGAGWLLCGQPEFWRGNSDDFLWKPEAPWLRHWAERDRFLAEAREISGRVLRQHPGEQVARSLGNFARAARHPVDRPATGRAAAAQLRRAGRADGRAGRPAGGGKPGHHRGCPAGRLSAAAGPGAEGAVLAGAGALAGIAALAWRARRGPLLAVAALALALVVGNAFLAGALSAVHGRYQSRITWPVTVLAVAAGAAALRPRGVWIRQWTLQWTGPRRHGMRRGRPG